MAQKTGNLKSTTSCIDTVEYVWAGYGLTARVLCFESGAPFRMQLDYWSQRKIHARHGEVYEGRVVGRDPGQTGVFVDIGTASHGFLSKRKGPAPTQGEWLTVRVKSEARQEKGPVLVRERMHAEAGQRGSPGRLTASDPTDFYRGVTVSETLNTKESSEVISTARDLALGLEYILPEGARLTIEPTRAMVAIDVDSAHVQSRGARESMNLAINLNAVRETARLLSLKGLAGLVAIDLMKLTSPQNRLTVEKAFDEALSVCFGRRCEVGRISRFGVLEASIARRERSIAETTHAVGEVELCGLGLLDALFAEGQSNRGARLELVVSSQVAKWLRTPTMDWQEWMSDRIGHRFNICEEADRLMGDDYVKVY